MAKVVQELEEACAVESSEPFVRLFFTKETHMHALMNLIRYSGIPLSSGSSTGNTGAMTPTISKKDISSELESLSYDESVQEGIADLNPLNISTQPDTNEVDLDYLSQICFEFYEKTKPDGHRSYSIRIGISKGAHDAHLFDLQMDAKHAVTVKGRTWITEYLDGEQVLSWFHSLVN